MFATGTLAALAVATLIGAVAACSSVTAPGVPQAASGAPMAGAIVGPMTVERGSVDGRVCYWLVADDGVKHGAVWPYGTAPNGSGLAVPTRSGVVIVTPGQKIWVTGGLGEADDDAGPLGACAAGVAVYVGSVSFSDPAGGAGG